VERHLTTAFELLLLDGALVEAGLRDALREELADAAAFSAARSRNAPIASPTASASPIIPAWHAPGRCTKSALGAA
jgi:hypothetical protein